MLHKKSVIIITLLFLSLVYFSCQKDSELIEPNQSTTTANSPLSLKNGISKALFDARIVGESNAEMYRIFEELNDFEKELSVVDNPNFGSFSANQQYDILLGGKTNPNLSIKLNGTEYSPSTFEGNWYKQSLQLKDYFNTNVVFEMLLNDELIDKRELYIPQAILCEKLGQDVQSLNIVRNQNTLKWNSDPSNPSDKIILYYSTYNNHQLGDTEGMLKTDFLILDDNGTFNIDQLISNEEIQRISFSLVRGNGFSSLIDGEKTIITIRCVDSHEYLIME